MSTPFCSFCLICESSNPDRKKDDKIRCTRFHEWRLPLDSCEYFFDRDSAKRLEEIGKLKGLI